MLFKWLAVPWSKWHSLAPEPRSLPCDCRGGVLHRLHTASVPTSDPSSTEGSAGRMVQEGQGTCTTARACCGTLTCSGPSRRQAGFRGPEASLSSTGWYDTWHLQIAQGPVKGCASVLDQGFEAQRRVPAFPGASEPPRNSAYVTDPNLHEFRFHPPVFVLGSS